jgi:hypothetical protein
MQFIKSASALFLVFCVPFAATSKIDKAKQIAEFSGLRIIIEKQKQLSASQNIAQTKQGLEGIKKSIQIADQDFWKQIDNSFEMFCKNVSNLINTDSAIIKWAEIYAQEYTESELDSLLAFYKTSLGQKCLKNDLIVSEKWQEYVSQVSSGKLKQISETFHENLNSFCSK